MDHSEEINYSYGIKKTLWENKYPRINVAYAVVGAVASVMIVAPVTFGALFAVGGFGIVAGGIGFPAVLFGGAFLGKALMHAMKNINSPAVVFVLVAPRACADALFVKPFKKLKSLFNSKAAAPTNTPSTPKNAPPPPAPK